MALPFVLFPSAITNSLAVVLLPAVSEAQAQNQPDKIERTISMALRYSLYMGILCVGSSPTSVQHWAKPFTTTPMPDVSSRFYPGSARFSTSPLPWEVF